MVITTIYLFSIFMSFTLGSEMNAVKEKVKESTIFYYETEEVEFPFPEKQILKFDGKSHIKYAYFSFDKNKLFSYTFVFDKTLITQYSIVLEVQKKFGQAKSVTPNNYYWDTGEHIISLNKNILRITLKSYSEKGTSKK